MMTFRLHQHFSTGLLALAALGLTLQLALTTSAQERKGQTPKPQDEVLRIETELVQIDVVVADKQGKLVRDLKREDFALFEDGKPQTISHFSIGTAGRQATWLRPTAAKTAGTPVNTAPAPVANDGRYLVLAVDDLHLAPGSLMPAKQALLKFVDQQLAGNDQIALVTTSGSLGMYQQFTTDRDAIRRAVNRLNVRERQATSSSDIPRITPYQAELIEMNDRDALELAVQEAMARLGMMRDQAENMARTQARQIIAQNTNVTVATLGTIENVVRGLKDLPGRKVIALLSDGFLLGGFREGRHFDVRRITDAATRAGVVIYSIDARGLIAMPSTMDASQPGFADAGALGGARLRIEQTALEAQRDGIYALARDTGGLAVFNNNDLNAGLQKILDDTETYYLLAFEPTISYRDGRFRKLEIRLPGRPDLKIRTRKGYFAPDDKAAEKEARAAARAAEKDKEKPPEKLAKEAQAKRDAQVRAGVGALYSLRGIPLELATSFINTAPDGSLANIVAHIDANGLNFTSAGDRQRATLEIVGLVFDEAGKVVENFSEKVEMNMRPASLENLLKKGVIYQKFVKLKPGHYNVRLVAREDGATQLGSASNWIEIPDLSKKQLALSSIFFMTADEATKLAQTVEPATVAANKDAATKSDGRTTQIYRRFARGAQFDFMIFAYNAKLDAKGAADVIVQVQVYAGSKLVFAAPPRNILPNQPTDADNKELSAIDLERIPYLARLSLADFEPGSYELRLVVIDRRAKISTRRSTNFIIE